MYHRSVSKAGDTGLPFHQGEPSEKIPEDKLLIETDSPYLSPEPLRGKRNNSMNVKYVAEKIACVRNKTVEEIAEITSNNAKRIFEVK